MSVKEAAVKAGFTKSVSTAGRLLENPAYLGTSLFPRIIDPLMFQQVQSERLKRLEKNHVKKRHARPAAGPAVRFTYVQPDFTGLKEPAEIALAVYKAIKTEREEQ